MVDFFKTFLETVERLMYGVDEWLRFKSGDSRFFFAMKAVLGLAWSAVAYVLRFCVNLLIEPQINPIKHFPVVTVSHKLLLPLYPVFGRHFRDAHGEGIGLYHGHACSSGAFPASSDFWFGN